MPAKNAPHRRKKNKSFVQRPDEHRAAEALKKIAVKSPAKISKKQKRPPDFMAILKAIYGNKVAKVTGADLVSEQRGDF